MIVVPVKEGENIEKALKKFKKTVCFEKTEDGTCYLRSENAADRRIINSAKLI